MSRDEEPFVLRRARAPDKEVVLQSCQCTPESGDYVPLVWDEWLTDGQGALLVATAAERPVGVAKVSMLTPAEAWLQRLHVLPGTVSGV
ncbi:MAG: hypothetical protein AMJ93_08440 [Anaerolineae bacterium SM23_84]|nr:MAG: hypothetical protein AMJ93_08440 [Anaerolineae bacterium SM23_84]